MCVCVQVNDEGYTPLMEASREGHEEMVALLLSQGSDINAQTEETQETALTLACCGGFLEVADFLIKVQPLLFLVCFVFDQVFCLFCFLSFLFLISLYLINFILGYHF